MTDEELEKEIDDLVGMIHNLRRITDKGRRRKMKAEIRHQLTLTMKL